MPCETCKQSYLDSYEVTVETIRQSQPGLSDHNLRVSAAAAFRPKHIVLRQASSIENSGKEVYENGEFTMIDGRMYFPATGEFAESLHENQLTISRLQRDPTKYSKADHDRTLLVQRSLAGGATVAKTVFDGVDGIHRDLVEYQYDPKTNRGKIVVHDMSKQYGSLDMTGMKQVAFRQSQDLKAEVQSENVFVLTNAPHIITHRVDNTVRMKENVRIFDTRPVHLVNQLEPQPLSTQIIRHANETINFVGRRAFRDTSETIRGVERWVKERTTQKALNKMEGLGIIGAAQLGVREIIVKHYKMFERQRKRLVFIEKTRVGTGAAPEIFRILSEQPPAIVRSVEKSMRRHGRKELRMKNGELRRITKAERKVSVGDQFRKIKKVESFKVRKKEKQRKKPGSRRSGERIVEKVVNKKAIADRMTLFIREKTKKKRKRLRQFNRKHERLAMHKKETTVKKERVAIASQEQVLRSWERQAIAQLSFAWVMYLFLNAERNVIRSPLALRQAQDKQQGVTLKKEDNRKHMNGAPIEQAKLPWILLSIIWYLSLMREAGLQMSNNKYPISNKNKKKILQNGIIFAFIAPAKRFHHYSRT